MIGRSFDYSLGQLLQENVLSKKAIGVKNLNFKDPSMRGHDIRRSVLATSQYARNAYSFNTELRSLLGAKNGTDMIKKVGDYEFNSALKIIAALGAQLNRMHERNILNGMDFREAYFRKRDQFDLLMHFIMDFNEFGISFMTLNQVYEFSAQMVDPKMDLTAIVEKDMDIVATRNNDPTEVDTPLAPFQIVDGKVTHAISNKRNCTGPIKRPLCDHWEKFRANFSPYQTRVNYYDLIARRANIEYCSNGACWYYNWGCLVCPFADPCEKKNAAHLALHVCALDGQKHRLIECNLIHSTFYMREHGDPQFASKKYSATPRQRKREPDNRSRREKEKRQPYWPRAKGYQKGHGRGYQGDRNFDRGYGGYQRGPPPSQQEYDNYYGGYQRGPPPSHPPHNNQKQKPVKKEKNP